MKKLMLYPILFFGVLNDCWAQSECNSDLSGESCVTLDVVKHGIPNPDLYLFVWDFGDGQEGKGAVTTHCYEKPGDYKVLLSLINKENGAYFKDELDLDINIEKSGSIAIDALDSIKSITELVPHLAYQGIDQNTNDSVSWTLNGITGLEINELINSHLTVGNNKLKADIRLANGQKLCNQKQVFFNPISYETRYLNDRIYKNKKSLIWSGNTILIDDQLIKLTSIFFNIDESELSDQAKSILNENVNILNRYSGAKFQIGSFTHSGGNYDLNRKISIERSQLIKNYLQTKGIAEDRILIADPNQITSLKNTCTSTFDCGFVNEDLNLRSDFKILEL